MRNLVSKSNYELSYKLCNLEPCKSPAVGQYNPRFDVTRNRVDKWTYQWKENFIAKKAKARKNRLKSKQNNEPVWERIIRTLNKKRKWRRPNEFSTYDATNQYLDNNDLENSKTINISSEQNYDNEDDSPGKSPQNHPQIRFSENNIKTDLKNVLKHKKRIRDQIFSEDCHRQTRTTEPLESIHKRSIMPSTKSNSRNRNIFAPGLSQNMKNKLKALSPSNTNRPEYFLVFKEYERFIERSDVPSTNNEKAGCLLFEK